MSAHSEKLLEVEMELRELRPLRAMRDEVEALRGSVESMRTVVSSLDSGRVGSSSGSHTLGKNASIYIPQFFITIYCTTLMISVNTFRHCHQAP